MSMLSWLLSSRGFGIKVGLLGVIATIASLIAFEVTGVGATHEGGGTATYTTDADFNQGTKINVTNSVPNQLQLNSATQPFNFIWVAVSTKGTIVKINTDTGQIVGEYATAPDGMGKDPSRTTVDKNGNVWVSNRGEWGFVDTNAIAVGLPPEPRGMGSVTHVGLVENNQCVDRNNNSIIETSTGQDDIKGWTNGGAVDSLGGVSTALDECIIHYTRMNSSGGRHVSVNSNNDVWVSGTGGQYFDLIDGDTGQVIRQENPVGIGGYGGLIDANDVIWSASGLLWWDTDFPLISENQDTGWKALPIGAYGLCRDAAGNVFATELGSVTHKFHPDGTEYVGSPYNHGFSAAQGCVVDGNGHVWVAHSILGGSSVGHLLNDGTYIGNVAVGSGPTGVAVDTNGKIWATNYYDGTVSRINPNMGDIGADSVTKIGAVDFTTVNLGGNPYNYSDMTGSTLIGAPNTGAWSLVRDGGVENIDWTSVDFTADIPQGTELVVRVSTSHNGLNFSQQQIIDSGDPLTVPNGRFVRVNVSFERGAEGDSPILYDVVIHSEAPHDAPTGLDCLAGNGEATLSWSAVPNATYTLYMATEPWTVWSMSLDGAMKHENISQTNYLHTDLDNGTTYYFAVAAAVDGDEGAHSDQVDCTPEGEDQVNYELTVALDGDGTGSVSSQAPGIDCGSDCSEMYEDGSVVVLNAIAAPGSSFIGWTGDCSGLGGCLVTMDSNRSVVAHFESNEPKLVPGTPIQWLWVLAMLLMGGMVFRQWRTAANRQ